MPAINMQCPVCAVPLVMSERQTVEIDYCPQCRGVWLDRGELDKIIERAASEQQQFTAPQRAAPAQAHPGYPPQRYDTHHYKKRRKSFLEELFD